MDPVWKQTSVQELLDPLLANISEPVWFGYKLDPASLLRFCLNYNNDAFFLINCGCVVSFTPIEKTEAVMSAMQCHHHFNMVKTAKQDKSSP